MVHSALQLQKQCLLLANVLHGVYAMAAARIASGMCGPDETHEFGYSQVLTRSHQMGIKCEHAPAVNGCSNGVQQWGAAMGGSNGVQQRSADLVLATHCAYWYSSHSQTHGQGIQTTSTCRRMHKYAVSCLHCSENDWNTPDLCAFLLQKVVTQKRTPQLVSLESHNRLWDECKCVEMRNHDVLARVLQLNAEAADVTKVNVMPPAWTSVSAIHLLLQHPMSLFAHILCTEQRTFHVLTTHSFACSVLLIVR